MASFDGIKVTGEPHHALRIIATHFATFACEDLARYKLLLLRTILDFELSSESYALAVDVSAKGRRCSAIGLENDNDFDLCSALVARLASQ